MTGAGCRAGLCLLLLLAGAGIAAAEPATAEIAVTGQVEHPGAIGDAALHAMPPATVQVTQTTGRGPQTVTYTGALLWTLVQQAGPSLAQGPRTLLQRVVLAQGRDGYAVALAIGELDPEFEGKQVLVAYARDGQPLPTLQLVVPGDKRAGRGVRDLVAIEVR